MSDDQTGSPQKPSLIQKTVKRKTKVNNFIALMRILTLILVDQESTSV